MCLSSEGYGSERMAVPQVAVVQNMPLNDHGNGPAPVGGSHFQPLPTNLAGVGLSGGGAGAGAASGSPQILTGEAALASLGQGGHTAQGSAKQVTGAGQVRTVHQDRGSDIAPARSMLQDTVNTEQGHRPGTASSVQRGVPSDFRSLPQFKCGA